MKYILILSAVLILFSCSPMETPYFVMHVDPVYSSDPYTVAMNVKIPYEFSSEEMLMIIHVDIFCDNGGWDHIWNFEELASESGYIVLNDNPGGEWEVDLADGYTYAIEAVLLSDRYGGDPQPIESLRIWKEFNVVF